MSKMALTLSEKIVEILVFRPFNRVKLKGSKTVYRKNQITIGIDFFSGSLGNLLSCCM